MKTKQELEKYIPKDKFDNFEIENLNTLSNEELTIILPELLLWFKNMNNIVSKELTVELRNREEVLRPFLLESLKDIEIDSVWKYNIITYLIKYFTASEINNYKEVLNTIATNPNTYELDHEVNVVAMEVLSIIK